MTNSTSKTQISVDMPNLASCDVRFTLTGLGVNAVDEVFPPVLEQTTGTLDSAGEDDGALYLTTPDATGTSSYAWLVEARPANADRWTTVGSIAVTYSASAQELGALLEASDSAIAATQTGITVAESTWLTAEIAATGATADGNLLQSDGTNSEDAGIATSAVVTTAGATMAGTLAMADNLITRPVFKDYGETVNAIGSIGGGSQDIDLTLGNVVSGTVDTSATTFTFSNPPASGTYGGFVLILTNGGSQTVNWPNSVRWAGGTAPTLTASGVDRLVFDTVDGGTTWDGFAAGLAMA